MRNNAAAPWARSRGLGRLLAQETNVSDLIQFLSDRDPSPWRNLVGFIPEQVDREVLARNHADLQLTSGSHSAVVEVKLGHQMSTRQQAQYEALRHPRPDLYFAALDADGGRLADTTSLWTFVGLGELIGSWEDVDDIPARSLAGEAAGVLRGWDRLISGVFGMRSVKTWKPLSVLDQKFLGRVVSRRIAQDLRSKGRLAQAGTTSGGGLPLVQGWAPVRGEGQDRAFIAEVRWWESKPGGELRFGVDFDPRPGRTQDEEVRRAAYGLAQSMNVHIAYEPLRSHLLQEHPDLAKLLRRETPSRPKPKGDWERVLVHGFKGAPLQNGAANNRARTTPDFYGDGALRHEAIADIDFGQASAVDLIELIDTTLDYLTARQP